MPKMGFLAIFASVSLFLLLPSVVRGQCYGDDGFSIPGTCCVPVLTANLPVFPAATIPSDGACFLNCNVEAAFPVTITLAAPIFVFCDLYLIPITVSGSVSTAPSFLIAKYTRTWLDFGLSGTVKQVWRFVVNADLQYVAPFFTPCPTPACAAVGLPVHFVGSIDYAGDCTPPLNFEVTINLTHLCGSMAHGPASNRPTAASHPERMFAFVGPAPFNFSTPVPLPGGLIMADAARSTTANLSSLQWDCHGELPIPNGQMNNLGNACLCATSSASPPRWDLLDLRLDYSCSTPAPNNFMTIPWGPVIPTGMSAFPLGQYALPPSAYASGQTVSVCFGLAVGQDPCANNFPFHFVYGTATSAPGLLQLFNQTAVYQYAIDLVNCKAVTTAAPFLQTVGYGSLFGSTMVWSFNL